MTGLANRSLVLETVDVLFLGLDRFKMGSPAVHGRTDHRDLHALQARDRPCERHMHIVAMAIERCPVRGRRVSTTSLIHLARQRRDPS